MTSEVESTFNPLDYMGLAHRVAKTMGCPSMTRQDLVQEAMIALYEASESHCATRGDFMPWAAATIRWHLLKVIADNTRVGRFGSRGQNEEVLWGFRRTVTQEGFAKEQAHEVLTRGQNWSRKRTTVTDAARAMDFAQRPEKRLDAVVRRGRGGDAPSHCVPLVETLADDLSERDGEQAVVRSHWRRFFESFDVDGRERYILKNRILADEPEFLQSIADKYGLSRERIRQIESQLLRRLKKEAISNGLIEARSDRNEAW